MELSASIDGLCAKSSWLALASEERVFRNNVAGSWGSVGNRKQAGGGEDDGAELHGCVWVERVCSRKDD